MLLRFYVHQFRNYPQLDFYPDPRLSVIIGANGSGKTSLLESIYTLSTGRSFRTSQCSRMIRHGEPCFNLFADVIDQQRIGHTIGMSRGRSGIEKLKIDGLTVSSLSPLALLFPVQIFSPLTVDLVFGSSKLRRSFLDWGLFHVEHNFLDLFRRYHSCLQQRNRLLKRALPLDKMIQQLTPWDQQLIHISGRMDQLRLSYVKTLAPYFDSAVVDLNLLPAIKLDYFQGWTGEQDFSEALLGKRALDIERGFTSIGPHRADLKITTKLGSAKEMLSRGQSKLVAYALLLAQIRHFSDHVKKPCLILVDDLTAELDPNVKLKLLNLLMDSEQQIIVTTLDSQWLPTKVVEEAALFHVEHDNIVNTKSINR